MKSKNYSIKYTDTYNPVLVDQIGNQSTVLDIGCWTGGTGSFLIKNKKCVVEGIDFDANSLRIAKRRGYKKTYQLNLNGNYNLKTIKNNKYDFIILGDILEHLIYPEHLLSLLKQKIKRDGVILISTPNIAFILYRFMLLLGKFEYSKMGGVMDINHLRFFTKETIEKMCLSCGYVIIHSSGYNVVKDKFFYLRILGSIFPSLFALQFLIKLKR